jgi:pyruvate/2-oxoglutarate dehydrogenase complex dihydrolipoamide acyltransferase (E2) component
VLVPRENVNDESAMLVAWSAADGSRVEAGQCVAQVETSKAVVDVAAPAAGTLRHGARAGQEVAVGGVLGWVGDGAAVPAQARNGDAANGAGPRHLPPSVRRLVAEEDIDPAVLKGTGRDGRVTKADVLDHLTTAGARPGPHEAGRPLPTRISPAARELIRELGLDENDFAGRGLVRSRDVRPPEKPQATAAAAAPGTGPVAATGVPVRSEPLARAKRTEARYLRSGFEGTLASVVTVTCPTRGLREATSRFPSLGGSASALVVFEAARLLRAYPALNAYHEDGRAHYYEEVNIGFAVDAGRGLKVPVVRNADTKGAARIADEMRELVVAYLDDALSVAALAGGTFTVTDLSGEGVTSFHPLINQGQSSILGVCAEVFPGGGPVGAFNLVLAFDHQLTEGRAAARFLGELRDRLAHYESAASGGAAGPYRSAEPRCSRCQAGFRERAADGHALVQTVGPDGSTRLLCKLCFEGWV